MEKVETEVMEDEEGGRRRKLHVALPVFGTWILIED